MAGTPPNEGKIVAQLGPGTDRGRRIGKRSSGGGHRPDAKASSRAVFGMASYPGADPHRPGPDAGTVRRSRPGGRAVANVADHGMGRTRLRAARRPEVPGGLPSLRLRQPRRPARRHADAGQSGPAHQLRQIQSVHVERGRRAGPDLADVRVAADRQRRRDRQRLRAAGRGHHGGARRAVGDLPHPPAGALPQRRSGAGQRRQVFLRHADEQGLEPRLSQHVRRRQIADRDRRPHGALRLQAAQRRAAADRGLAAGVLAQMDGQGAVREADLRDARHQRPLSDRALRRRPRHHLQAQSGLLGQGPAGAARHLQLRPRGLPAVQGRNRAARGLQGGRVRRHRRVPLQELGQELCRQALRQRRADEDGIPAPQWRRHAGFRDEPAQAAVPGRARAPGADPGARLRMAEPAAVLRRLQAPGQLVLQQRAGGQLDLRRPSRPRRAGLARAAA